MKMMTKRKLFRFFIPSEISDFVSLIAGLIGIFGFLTGISSIPILLTTNSMQLSTTEERAWFFNSSIPLSLSIPVFIITLLFVYGVYFLFLIRVNQRLCYLGVITPNYQNDRWTADFDRRPGDTFSIAFFMILGGAIGFLLLRAFFYIPEDFFSIENLALIPLAVFLGPLSVILFIVFLYWLCDAARDTASRGSEI